MLRTELGALLDPGSGSGDGEKYQGTTCRNERLLVKTGGWRLPEGGGVSLGTTVIIIT